MMTWLVSAGEFTGLTESTIIGSVLLNPLLPKTGGGGLGVVQVSFFLLTLVPDPLHEFDVQDT